MTDRQRPTQIFDRTAVLRARQRALALGSASPGGAPDFLLRLVAEDILDRLSVIKRNFANGLELGCHGRGVGRSLIEARKLLTLTIADEIAEATPDLVIDFERLPFAPESFDLIVSGLVLHTVNDLPGVLAQLRASLKPDGLLLVALMGGRTLHELRSCFLAAETELTGGASPRVAPAIDLRDLGGLLQRAGFALPVVDSDIVDVTYKHPLALMHELRSMAATNVLEDRRRTFLRRDVLGRAMMLYQQRYAAADGRICATFEFLTATAWAPHTSQQAPLRPGTAKARLADILGDKAKDSM